MSDAGKRRDRGDARVLQEARARIVQTVSDIQAQVSGHSMETFFADDLHSRTVRKACELDMIRLANDVEEGGVVDHLSERTRRGLFGIRNVAAHGYVAMDEGLLWVALHDLQSVLDAVEAAATGNDLAAE